MITRILLPTDHSDLAAHAARHARFLAAAHGAEIHVLHVVAPASIAPVAGEIGTTTLIPDVSVSVDAQRPLLKRFVESVLDPTGIEVTIDVRVGVPHDVIASYAREHRIDLIVIGTHARGLVNRIFFGSTSKAVLESAPCPVLMVPLATMPDPP